MIANLNLAPLEPGMDGLFRTRLAGHHARTSEAFGALRLLLQLASTACMAEPLQSRTTRVKGSGSSSAFETRSSL